MTKAIKQSTLGSIQTRFKAVEDFNKKYLFQSSDSTAPTD